ncbi:hypothetical protein [Shinella kummerowiae]|uniref:hypothetical protein n=1 Tax=Shinella kummerowiae TaxID=417745 RepID=UPI0021B57BDC|nr:hypothetical protein [Shinella kummerowiae]MCT7662327.1 hypothetical protein [Shinella kummerowiae]
MSIDRQTIINMALTDIGAGPMFSVDDDSDLASQIELQWQAVVDRTIGMHPWSFCRRTFRNTRQAGTPENGWRYCFELPGDRIGNPLKILDQAGQSPRPLKYFTIEEGKLFANCEETWSLCKVEPDPDYWPPEWRGAFIVALGAYLAVPVWQDTDMRNDMLVEAFGTPSREGTGGLFGRLMGQDRASEPVTQGMEEDALTSARAGGADGYYPWYGRL